MKYTSKITASLLAALMIAGTATAVPSQTDWFGTSVSAAYTTYTYVDDISCKLYNTCVRVTWTGVSPCSYYLVQLCNGDGSVVNSFYAQAKSTTIVIPYTAIPMDADEYGRLKDTKCSVSIIGIYGNNVNESDIVPYIVSSATFTVKPDMSGYEAYGKPQDLSASCTDNSMTITWKNSALTGDIYYDYNKKYNSNYNDVFNVKVLDSRGKTVYNSDTKTMSVTINKLLYNNTYTVTVTNKTYNASSSIKATVKSPDKKDNNNGHDVLYNSNTNNNNSASSTVSSSTKLPAPKNLKAKSGDEKIVLTWSKVSGADAYRVYIFDEAKGKYVRYKTVKGTKCTLTDLVGDKEYKFRVAGAVYNKSTKKYTSGKACAPVTARYASKDVAPSYKY